MNLAWKIEFEKNAKKEIKKIDRQAQRVILRFLREKIATNENPRRFGGPLTRNLIGLWKYRVGDYRLICDIQEKKVVVLVLRVGHRRKIYGGH